MALDIVHIGFNSLVAMNRVLAMISPEKPGSLAVSQPIRRMVEEARQSGRLIDVTYGRKTRAILILDTGHVVLAPIQPETVVGRWEQQRLAMAEQRQPGASQVDPAALDRRDLARV